MFMNRSPGRDKTDKHMEKVRLIVFCLKILNIGVLRVIARVLSVYFMEAFCELFIAQH